MQPLYVKFRHTYKKQPSYINIWLQNWLCCCSFSAFGEDSSWGLNRGYATESITEKSHLLQEQQSHREVSCFCTSLEQKSCLPPTHQNLFQSPKGKLCVKFMPAQRATRSRPAWSQAEVYSCLVCPLLQRNPPRARSDFSQVESQAWFTEQKTSLAGSQLRICPWHTREIFRLIGCQPKQCSASLMPCFHCMLHFDLTLLLTSRWSQENTESC